ncbi:ATP-binding protein [Streptomyces sp. ME18-1-4]|uniref:ATP-binding protein n=1 Tax=Streptomyces sp. ME18-1-4 TaxID=3028685 RepID=UPI0029C9E9C2|nr:ATP-binding protein [Streptomyces sp. ME18-1-4]
MHHPQPPTAIAAADDDMDHCNTATAHRLTEVLRRGGQEPYPPLLDLELRAVPEAVPDLRRAVRHCLGVPCADVQLCVTELVANVIRHVGEGAAVRVRVARVGGRRIRVEVSDLAASALPEPLRASDDDESGRGLALLDAVVLRWGVGQGVEGKTVWCELDHVG